VDYSDVRWDLNEEDPDVKRHQIRDGQLRRSGHQGKKHKNPAISGAL
jgi:hypothetical protein